jgi:hypothetical protein
VLNPNAWADPPDGQFDVSAAYYTDYRQMRRPQATLSMDIFDSRLLTILSSPQMKLTESPFHVNLLP